jgi:hypothetical protein
MSGIEGMSGDDVKLKIDIDVDSHDAVQKIGEVKEALQDSAEAMEKPIGDHKKMASAARDMGYQYQVQSAPIRSLSWDLMLTGRSASIMNAALGGSNETLKKMIGLLYVASAVMRLFVMKDDVKRSMVEMNEIKEYQKYHTMQTPPTQKEKYDAWQAERMHPAPDADTVTSQKRPPKTKPYDSPNVGIQPPINQKAQEEQVSETWRTLRREKVSQSISNREALINSMKTNETPRFKLDKDYLNPELAKQVKWMSPKKFLEQTPSPDIFGEGGYKNAYETPMGVPGYNQDKVAAYRKQLKGGEAMAPLELDFRNQKGEWPGHDGRHRAKAAALEGVNRVPVFIQQQPQKSSFVEGTENTVPNISKQKSGGMASGIAGGIAGIGATALTSFLGPFAPLVGGAVGSAVSSFGSMQGYEQGGNVQKTGPAYLHQGEAVVKEKDYKMVQEILNNSKQPKASRTSLAPSVNLPSKNTTTNNNRVDDVKNFINIDMQTGPIGSNVDVKSMLKQMAQAQVQESRRRNGQ